MVISTDSIWDELADELVTEYEDAIVYADVDQEAVLHTGDIRLLANGWVELPTGRLLSPATVHHIDTEG